MDKNENVVIMSADYSKAVKLTQHIKVHAEMMQTSLYEVCKTLKEVKDGKLYKELGYDNFEDYCQNEIGFTAQQGRKYLSIANMTELENRKSTFGFEKIGTEKLYLLSKLDEPERQEIQQTTDLESTTVKELKAKIAEMEKLKAQLAELEETNKKQVEKLQEAQEDIEQADQMYGELRHKYEKLEDENYQLGVELDDYRMQINEPPVIDATYTDNSEQIQELQDKLREQEEAHQQEVHDLKEIYETKIVQAKSTAVRVPDSRETYLAYIRNAREAVGHLKTFMKQHPEIAGSAYEYFQLAFETLANLENKVSKE